MTPIEPPGEANLALRERGMILVNVLVIVLMATAVLAIMLASEDSDLERSRQLHSAAQAMAIARGGELTAIIALRRDLASGSTTDTLDEPWANIADHDVRIASGGGGASGTFSFVVADAQARFNINDFALGDAISQDDLRQLATIVGVGPDRIAALLVALKAHGPISDLSELRAAGLNDDELRRLAFFCAALPEPTTVNVNTASEALLAVVTGNPAIAHAIVLARVRAGAGGLSAATSQFILPPGTGVSSNYFWTRARVTVGGTTQQLTSLLHRRLAGGKPIVEAVRRWRGAAPLGAPDFPEARS